MTKKDYEVNLDALCGKLEGVCRKVWDEDRLSAVALQAVSNEIVAELRTAKEVITHLRQELQTQEAAVRRECETRTDVMAETLNIAKTRAAAVEEELRKARAQIESIRKDLETREEENALFQEKHLKLEAQRDSERAAHMEEFIAEMETKEQEREAFWKQRHQVLENDLKAQQEELRKQHNNRLKELEGSAEEARKLEHQKETQREQTQKQLQSDLQRREELLRGQELENVKRFAELEKLKHDLRAEISELTRQYQPKPRADQETK